MSSLQQINEIDYQINSLRIELIKIIAQINFTIGSDRHAIMGSHYQDLKREYTHKKNEINSLHEAKNLLRGNLTLVRV